MFIHQLRSGCSLGPNTILGTGDMLLTMTIRSLWSLWFGRDCPLLSHSVASASQRRMFRVLRESKARDTVSQRVRGSFLDISVEKLARQG